MIPNLPKGDMVWNWSHANAGISGGSVLAGNNTVAFGSFLSTGSASPGYNRTYWALDRDTGEPHYYVEVPTAVLYVVVVCVFPLCWRGGLPGAHGRMRSTRCPTRSRRRVCHTAQCRTHALHTASQMYVAHARPSQVFCSCCLWCESFAGVYVCSWNEGTKASWATARTARRVSCTSARSARGSTPSMPAPVPKFGGLAVASLLSA